MATTAINLPLSSSDLPSQHSFPASSAIRIPSFTQTSPASRKWLPTAALAAFSRENRRRMINRSREVDANFTKATQLLLLNQLSCTLPSNGSSSSVYQPRPAIILPGLGNNSGDYLRLQGILEGYGITSVIANVSRPDWLRNAAGLLDLNYWKGTLQPRPVLDWYLKRSLSLIGHSAGGWLARVYMEEFGASDISLLLTLGTPHTPPPKGVSGVIDQTRGLLYYVQDHCAKAVYTPELKYVCVAGRYIQGARIFNEQSEVIEDTQYVTTQNNDQELVGVATLPETTTMSTSTTTTFRAKFVGQGYKQVCGRADVWGDGVVPEESAYLEGALNIGLEGIYHSPVGSDDVSRPWYGSPVVVEQWIEHLLDK
ncbi:hypothetical protein V2J09_017426 [Rumex salicifolius]